VPLAFLHVIVKVYCLVVCKVAVFSLPDPAFVPLQSPLAVQLVGLLVASQRMVLVVPPNINAGAAAMVTTGLPLLAVVEPVDAALGVVTLTATVAKPVPLSVLQVSVNK
jgi:hypothetical protein